MPSGLVNNTLSGLSQGVTQQYQEGRYDSQVSSMVNCMPSITRGVLRRNPIQGVSLLEELPDITTAFSYSYDRGTALEQYLIILPGDGYLYVYNTTTGGFIEKEGPYDYLNIIGTGITARDAFEAMTLGDHTFIINKTVTVGFSSDTATSLGYSDMAFYWIKKTASVIVDQEQVEDPPDSNIIISGSSTLGYTYTLNNTEVVGRTDSRPSYPQIDENSSFIIAELFTKNGSGADEHNDSFAFNRNFTGTDWTWEDTYGNTASFGAWMSITDSSDLPATLPKELDGFIVKVSGGTTATFDDYYLKYYYDSRSWKECPAPGKRYKLDPNTMPHVIYRLTTGFKFDTYQTVSEDGTSLTGESAWATRESGGDDDTQDPSFIGKTLSNIFFFKNRLGLITSDSIILSCTGDYGNFFPTTVQDILDSDPIDLSVASTDVTLLRAAVPTAGQLILFSDDTQFILESTDGPLTPLSADISAISNYTYGSKAKAKAIGDKVYFTSSSGGYSQLYAYKSSGSNTRVSTADSLTIHLPTYIDSSVNCILGHDVLGNIFMTTSNIKNELIVLNTITKDGKDLQNAFHKWKFKYDIVSIHIIKTDLYILFSNKELAKIKLDLPGSITQVEYIDKYLSGSEEYESYIKFSQFFIRDNSGKGTSRGRYQLRTLLYTITSDSEYSTVIANFSQPMLVEDSYGVYWNDGDIWNDDLVWMVTVPYYTREYGSDKKVTVMTSSDNADITFRSSKTLTHKGFELATVNVEALYSQRSRRI